MAKKGIVGIEDSQNSPLKEQSNSTHHILLADDDLYIRELYASALIRSGFQVDTVADGAAAWKVLCDNDFYTMLITDQVMPKLTGLELIEKLRLSKSKLPIILMSATMPIEDLKRRPELRPNASLTKPFTIGQLLDTVNEVLRQAPATESVPYHAALDEEASRAEKSAGATNRGQINPAYSILVVDDDDAIRELNMDVLAGSGYEVAGAKNGAAGWQAIRNNDFDLIVTDNKMPKMTGIEMIGKLRSAGMTVPVIMATGILPTQEFIRSPWLKPDAALERPFSNGDLLAAVNNILRREDGASEGQETLLPKYL